jgi:hypothetical protein
MRFLNSLNGTSAEKTLTTVRNALSTTIAANVPVYAITSAPNGVTVPDGTYVTDVDNGNQCMGYTIRAIPPGTAPVEVLAWGYHDGLGTFVSVFGSGGGGGGTSLQLSYTVEPTPDITQLGKLILVSGGTGVADELRMCIKDALDNYIWTTISLS